MNEGLNECRCAEGRFYFVEGDEPVVHISVVGKVGLAVICQAVM